MPQAFANAYPIRKLPGILIAMLLLCCFSLARAAQIQVPSTIVAGSGLTIPTSGNGQATFYLIGSGIAIKRTVQLGQNIKLSPDDLKNAGRYVVSLEGSGSATFFVTAGATGALTFLARPSRVPADTPNVIAGTVFVFDKYQNLVLQPAAVKFDLSLNGETVTRTEMTKSGVAYIKLPSSRTAGAAEFVASSGDASVRRVVQQVASDPCSIQMRAQPEKDGILVQTDPIHDCAGNPVPDGTIVTFTLNDAKGKSTVDARIKQGVAEAQLPASGGGTISVASGVVVGNEIQWRGQ